MSQTGVLIIDSLASLVAESVIVPSESSQSDDNLDISTSKTMVNLTAREFSKSASILVTSPVNKDSLTGFLFR